MSIPVNPELIRVFGPDLVKFSESKSITSLKLNDVLSARVLKDAGPGQVLMAVRGGVVTAKSSAALVPGRVYLMEVKALSPVPILALAQGAAKSDASGLAARLVGAFRESPFKPLARLAPLLSQIKAPDQAAAQVRDLARLFASLTLGGEKGVSPNSLREFIKGSGLMWESKIQAAFSSPANLQTAPDLAAADLKGLALQLLASQGAMDPQTAERILSFTESLQNLQAANVSAFEENGRFFASIPFLHGEEHRFVEFLADFSGGGSGPKKQKRLLKAALCLDLTNLGPLRADAALLGLDVKAAFTVSSQDAADHLKSRFDDLRQGLAGNGFSLISAECVVEDESVLKNSSLADELFEDPENGLDIRI